MATENGIGENNIIIESCTQNTAEKSQKGSTQKHVCREK